MNSLPNTIWGETPVLVKTLTSEEVKVLLTEQEFTSAVGHADFAEILSTLSGVTIPANRVMVNPVWGFDQVLAGLVTTPRRLAEGEKWTSSEVLQMPVKWVFVK
jgi:hypothetical protein